MGGEGDVRWNGTQEMEVRSTGMVGGGGGCRSDRGFSEERAKIRVKISLLVEKENSAFITASKCTGTSQGSYSKDLS